YVIRLPVPSVESWPSAARPVLEHGSSPASIAEAPAAGPLAAAVQWHSYQPRHGVGTQRTDRYFRQIQLELFASGDRGGQAVAAHQDGADVDRYQTREPSGTLKRADPRGASPNGLQVGDVGELVFEP